MLLSIDSATHYASVAIGSEDHTLVQASWQSKGNHSEELLPSIEYVLQVALPEQRLKAIDAIGVVSGPGSFSALRVGLSTAKGLAFSQDIPLVCINTLELEAYPYRDFEYIICPVIPLGKVEYAYAFFLSREGKWEQIRSDSSIYHEELPTLADKAVSQISAMRELLPDYNLRLLFCGEGIARASEKLREITELETVIIPEHGSSRRPNVLNLLAHRELQAQRTFAPDSVQPNYLKHPTITMPKATSKPS